MKKISRLGTLLLLFTLVVHINLFAQPKNNPKMNHYDKEWESINKKEYDGLTKTALEETQKLYEKIKKNKKNPAQTAQLIKSLLFINKYQGRLEEDGLVKSIYRFQEEAEKATGPSKPILQSMVAEMYDQYLSHHLYKFRDRTATEEFQQDDIRTWDITRITNKCYELYNQSLAAVDTKEIPLENFKDITQSSYGAEGLMPTLYDFLMHRAINFFMSEKYYLTKPAYKFYIEQPEAIADAKTFIGHTFTAKDSLSSKFQTLQLFQELTKFHLDDKDPRAFIYTELRRLKYVKDKAILSGKNELYLERLEALQEEFKKNDIAAEIGHTIATYYHHQGNKYKPSPTQQYRWDIKTAYELCEKIIKQYPKSYGASHCKVLMNTIEQKDIHINVEKVNPTDKHLLALLSYKNLKKVHVRVVKMNENQYRTFNEKYNEHKVTYFNSFSPAHKWSLDIPEEGDFQNHSLEFQIPKLQTGRYVVAISDNSKFPYDKNGIAYSSFYVSNISISKRQVDGIHEFYINDRITGQPLEGAKVECFVQKWNSILRRYEYHKTQIATTDKNGWMQSKRHHNTGGYNSSFRLKVSYQKDQLYMDDTHYNYDQNEPYSTYKTHFFLDRAIYRPGQTVYFKGLSLSVMSDGKSPKIVTGRKTTLIFYDANSQEVTRKEVTTNEFGTFHGSFTAPASGLTGQMYIEDIGADNSRKYFRVEEYKRPKFEVKIPALKESFKLNDLVTVKGTAKAFAGSSIDGAKVQYRVTRQARFPYWSWWRWGWYIPFNQEQQEIVFGETETNELGEFEVKFEAIPDRSIPKDQRPLFIYTVYADVTDVTGETRSSQSSVRVGYIALDADIRIPDNVDRDEAKPFKLITQNLNYEFEAAKGEVTVEKIKTPKTVYTDRYWSKPDYFILDEKTFGGQFPYYAYKNEDEIQNWPIEKEVLKTSFDTEQSKKLKIDQLVNWDQGQYKLTLNTQDKYGEKIEIVKYFTVYSQKEKTVAINQALFLAQEYFYGIKPGEKVDIDFGSATPNAYILFEVEHDKKIISKQWVKAEGRQQVSLDIEEKHRGNLHFHLTSIQNSRAYYNNGNIYVPWTNKQLKIEYTTFRDKLLPGQEEEWQIKISGNKGDKIATEVLASMYDASLDAFAANYWSFGVHPTSYPSLTMSGYDNFTSVSSSLTQHDWNPYLYGNSRSLPYLNWHGFSFYEYDYMEGGRVYAKGGTGGGRKRSMKKKSKEVMKSEAPAAPGKMDRSEKEMDASDDAFMDAEETIAPLEQTATITTDDRPDDTKSSDGDFEEVKVRTNLNETVFFYPDLMTDEEGNVIIKFTMNEALTRWKFMTFGVSKNLQSFTAVKEVVTQKDLMVMPNAPRFFREGDEIYFTAKVSNLTEETMKGKAILQLFDAISMKPIDAAFGNANATLDFEAEGGRSSGLVWKLNIPDGWTNSVTHRVIAKSGDFSDGEESTLPVLTNRMLVTETQPLPIRGETTKKFSFSRMAEVSKSPTMHQHKLTLEFTPNPAWYAIQSLPYLMEYPYECTEQIFSRYYANSLASSVANSHPKVKRVFDQWKSIDTDALKSNLQKNEELKYALLEETPWVLQAQSEEQQKQNIGVLFDLNRMGNELDKARDKMADRQLANGGFSWFPGGRDSWYITQYIVEGMGHLNRMGVKDLENDQKMNTMMTRSVDYIDTEMAIYYKQLLRWAKESDNAKKYLERDHLSQLAIHYLYTRSFFLDQEVKNKKTQEAIDYFEKQAITYWRNKSLYMQGMLALAIHRKGKDQETPKKIVTAAKENALNSEEMGMYWKYPSGFYWYQLPIETHALMIEVFSEVAKDEESVEGLKVWLLKAKQTTHWKTTKATASACYALLMNGDNWLMEDQEVVIKLGGKKLDQSQIKKEAGTGYFKTTWNAEEIKPEMADITIKNPNKNPAWGALYWQYFEQLDKITHFKETPLQINKKLFKQINTDRGPVLKPIENEKLVPGDLVKVRVEIIVDRDMEYVHMKDMRAAGFEPVNVLSQYKYQGGLGYYESTRDASTNFFISYLSKGTYVFEYPLRVNHKGDFSNGVTTIQCMYAPEFTAHSEGVRVKIE
ncbi:MAG: alpha-2-macroglobulin [Aureispira sp.]|nr:alpha-2-macroglobulin [Aureispira sp.]